MKRWLQERILEKQPTSFSRGKNKMERTNKRHSNIEGTDDGTPLRVYSIVDLALCRVVALGFEVLQIDLI